ncbi:DNA gyrase inhibitor YacG [Thiobacter aerophilum]|uniref:DNA gyrase inhibitor YacG n=1 Tax=Thiobacter aerophilum TaxID=3121275 RepID=A0ABV0EFD2_9BURK
MTLRLVPCPVCGKPSPFDPRNPFRPFCSERCKLIDLGQWANESYRIPGPSLPEPPAQPYRGDED